MRIDKLSSPLDLVETSWPEKGDQLFTVDEYLGRNAYLKHFDNNWFLYISGYKQAGDILVDYLGDSSIDTNLLVFPIIFLYRQYLELHIKQILRYGNALFDRSPDFPKTHDLSKLWIECRKIIKEVDSEDSLGEDLEIVGNCIAEFSTKDPTSMAFRYPTDTSNKRALREDLEFIDLRNLAEVIDKISSFLDVVTDGILVGLDEKASCY